MFISLICLCFLYVVQFARCTSMGYGYHLGLVTDLSLQGASVEKEGYKLMQDINTKSGTSFSLNMLNCKGKGYSVMNAAYDFIDKYGAENVVGIIAAVEEDALHALLYFGKRHGIPIVSLRSYSRHLLDDVIDESLPFAAVVPSLNQIASVYFDVVKNVFKWEKFVLLGQTVDDSLDLLDGVKDKFSDDGTLKVEKVAMFGEMKDLNETLDIIGPTSSNVRVVLMVCQPTVSSEVLKAAEKKKMTGRGWVWLGFDWANLLHPSHIPFPYSIAQGSLSLQAAGFNYTEHMNPGPNYNPYLGDAIEIIVHAGMHSLLQMQNMPFTNGTRRYDNILNFKKGNETRVFTKLGQRVHSNVMLLNMNSDGTKRLGGVFTSVIHRKNEIGSNNNIFTKVLSRKMYETNIIWPGETVNTAVPSDRVNENHGLQAFYISIVLAL